MLLKTTLDRDRVYQTAMISLFEDEDMSHFDKYKRAVMWQKVIYYVNYREYKFDGCLYNPKVAKRDSNFTTSLFGQRGVKEYFIALVNDLKSKEFHPVIIDEYRSKWSVIHDLFIEFFEKVHISQDKCVLRNDSYRMSVFEKNLQAGPCKLVVLFGGLITIRISRQYHRAGFPGFPHEFPFQ